MGILKFAFFRGRQKKVMWLGVSGSTLNLISWACKGYTSTSEIKIFDSRVKPKVHNDEKRLKRQSVIPIYVTLYHSIMTLK